MRPSKRDLAAGSLPRPSAERPRSREHGPLHAACFPCLPAKMRGDGAFLVAANGVQMARHHEVVIVARKRESGYGVPSWGRKPANGEGSA
jgi:hypothetical protein